MLTHSPPTAIRSPVTQEIDMAIEGLWTVRFGAVVGEKVQKESGAVVTLRDGRIVGGDTWMFYRGTYTINERLIEIRVDSAVHFTVGGESMFGGPLAPHTLVGRGEIDAEDEGVVTATLEVEGLPGARLVAVLSKVADL
jgi:hypothetical protein